MAKNEIVNVLTIKTEQSQQTIKGLKKEIADLKKSLDTAVIGSDEFEKASKDLAMAQAELKTVMADGKKTTDNMEGSYNHLVATMAELKKAWKATADEVKRNELGQQIDSINNQLKALDGTIGNNQRLVGSYAEEFKKALGEQDDATIRTRTQLESVQKVTAGLANGYAAVQGAMTLLNIENENLQQAMVKMQSVMAIAQGVGGLKDLVEGLSRAKVAFQGAAMGATVMSAEATTASASMNGTAVATKTATVAMSGFKKALISTGIGALVVAVGLLIANWDKIKKLFDKTTPEEKAKKALAEVRGEVEKLVAQAAGSKIARFKELGRIFNDLGNNLNSKKQFVTQYASELANMGIKMTDVNTAEKIFNDKTGKYVEAVMARAKADAARAAATKKYSEYFEKEAELNVAIKKAEADPIKAGEENRTFWQGFDAYFSIRHSGENYWQKSNQQGQDHIVSLKAQKEALSQEREDVFNDLMNEAKAYDEIAKNILGGLYVSGTVGGTGNDAKTAAEERAKKQAEVLEEFRVSQLTEEEKKYYELEKRYQEYLKLFEGDTEKQLLVVQWYTDEYTKLVEKELDERIKADAEIAKSAEETRKKLAEEDKKRYDEAVAASKERLSAEFGKIDKKEEGKLYLNERQKPKGNGEINSIDNELAKLDGLKAITEEMSKLRIAAIEEEMKQFDESSARYIELQQQKIDITEQTERTISEIKRQADEQEKVRQRAVAKSITNTFTSALSSASDIIGALQEGIDTTNKEGFEKNKKMQIANATIGMLVGITNAMAGAYTSKSGPWDWILAGIQAATIATVGGIQIANISKQKFDGSGSGSVSVSPSMGFADVPVSYTRNLMGDKETENLNQEQRVYILESDIEESGRRVEVRDSNTNF